jgi:hypothetical protein
VYASIFYRLELYTKLQEIARIKKFGDRLRLESALDKNILRSLVQGGAKPAPRKPEAYL